MLFGRVFEDQTHEFGLFLLADALQLNMTFGGVHHIRECCSAIGKARYDGCRLRRVTAAKSSIEGGKGTLAFVVLGGDEQARFCSKNTCECTRGVPADVTIGSFMSGLAVFRGSLARPFQVTRYWSRSYPLPRSLSSQ